MWFSIFAVFKNTIGRKVFLYMGHLNFMLPPLPFKTRQQSQNGVTYINPQVSRPRLNYIFSSPRNGIFFFFAFFLGLHPQIYGSSQARSRIRAVAAGLRHSHRQRQIRDESATYTTVHCNMGSLTHWARPGIEPASSWLLVKFIFAAWNGILKLSIRNHLVSTS